MDMKKKLEGAYLPDKQNRKERVVIGMSGGIDSLVTAYLLKIQKYDLLAVTVVNSWDEFTGDQSKYFSCHISHPKLETIKEFCHRLNIPHNIIKAGTEFKEEVIEPWIADRILAKRPKQCWSCHELRILLLYQKMRESGAKHLATGHYAKLFHNETQGSVFVHTSNDEEHDQAPLLSTLPHEVLSSLILPLSDLTRKEVIKLGENFGITLEERSLKIHECLQVTEELKEVLLKKIPQKFQKEGEIMSADGSQNYGGHTGVVGHIIGESMEIRDGGKPAKALFGEYYYPDKRFLLFDESFFKRNEIMLKNCHFSEEVTLPEPSRAYLNIDHLQLECWIHLKSLSSVYVELTEEYKFLPGDIVSVVKKKGKNSKVFLTGEIELLPQDEIENEGEEGVQKVNPAIDF